MPKKKVKAWIQKTVTKFKRKKALPKNKLSEINTTQMSKLEAEVAHNLSKLRSVTVEDIMIPRADIVAVPVTCSLDDLLEAYRKSFHSRLPLFGETLDDILGFVHIKDLLSVAQKPKKFNLKSLLRKVLFVAPSLGAMDLLYRMQTKNLHLAIVVDEYGGTDGLITIDDILKKIVGDLDDEFDTVDDDPTITQQEDGSYLADARIPIDKVEECFGITFSKQEHEESDTLGGLIFALIGRIPLRGEVIQHDLGLEFQVLDVDPRRIHKILVMKK